MHSAARIQPTLAPRRAAASRFAIRGFRQLAGPAATHGAGPGFNYLFPGRRTLNELDLKIAALKGWKILQESPWGALEDHPEGAIWHSPINNRWSTSEHMALDLADELTDAGLHVTIASWNPGDGRRVVVKVAGLDGGPDAFKLKIEGSVRSETICRAWIAAREWMVGRNG